MTILALQYEKEEEIPVGFETLYSKKNLEDKETGEMVEVFKLTEVIGLKSQEDVDKLDTALKAERTEHGETKKKLKVWGEKDPEAVEAQEARLKELEAQIEALSDEGDIDLKVNKLVEARLAKATGPLERELKELKEKEVENITDITALRASIEDRDICDRVREAATAAKVNPSAMTDIELMAKHYLEKDDSGKLVTKDGIDGIAAGLSSKQFFEDIRAHKPHWFPISHGTGSVDPKDRRKIVGFDAPNPWSYEDWSITGQGAVVRDFGMDMAQKLARAMDTTVTGGKRPAAPAKA